MTCLAQKYSILQEKNVLRTTFDIDLNRNEFKCPNSNIFNNTEHCVVLFSLAMKGDKGDQGAPGVPGSPGKIYHCCCF